MSARNPTIEERIKKNVVEIIRGNISNLEPSSRDCAHLLIDKYAGISFSAFLTYIRQQVEAAGFSWADYGTEWRVGNDIAARDDLVSLYYTNFKVIFSEQKYAKPANAIKRDIFDGVESDIVERRIRAYKASRQKLLATLLRFAEPQIGGYAKCAHLYAKIAYPKNISNELRWSLNKQLKLLGFPRVYNNGGWYFKGLKLIDSHD